MTPADLFSRYHVSVAPAGHHHVREGWTGTDCPLCTPGAGRFRMGWKGLNHCSCWSCGKQDPVRMLALLLRLPEPEVRKLHLPTKARAEAWKPKAHGVYTVPFGVVPLTPRHRRYLESRRFDPDELVETWRLQSFSHLANRYAHRIFIPIHHQGRPVSWTSRSAKKDRNRRYLSAPPDTQSMSPQDTLYGWDLVENAAILFEGPADVWAIGPGAVASLGLGYSRRQVEMLSRLAVRVIAFDNEPEAQRRARELARQLACFPGSTSVAIVETAKDAAGATSAERKQLRRLIA